MTDKTGAEDDLERSVARRRGFVADWLAFAAHNKAWWITPIVLTLFLVAVLVVLSATAAGPLIYSLF